MAKIVNLIEDLIQTEYGGRFLSTVKEAADKHAQNDASISAETESGAARAGRLLGAFASVRREKLPDVFRWLGNAGAAPFLRSLPHGGRDYSSTRVVLMNLNKLVQTDLARMMEATSPLPEVDVELFSADAICIGIVASRETSALLEGFVRGCAEHFGERVQVRLAREPKADATARADRCVWEFDVLWERRDKVSSLFTTPRRTKARDYPR